MIQWNVYSPATYSYSEKSTSDVKPTVLTNGCPFSGEKKSIPQMFPSCSPDHPPSKPSQLFYSGVRSCPLCGEWTHWPIVWGTPTEGSLDLYVIGRLICKFLLMAQCEPQETAGRSLGQGDPVPGAGVMGSFRWISMSPTDPPEGSSLDLGLCGKACYHLGLCLAQSSAEWVTVLLKIFACSAITILLEEPTD